MFVSFITEIIHRYRATLIFLLILIVAGLYSYVVIPKESKPQVKIPIITISLSLEGISAEDGEKLLLRPVEKKVSSIEGIKEMTSYSTQGSARVILEFNAGFNSEKALRDVKDKVDEVKKDLPRDADEPVVREIDLSLFPVLNVILQSDMPELTLGKIAEDLRDKIEALPNILSVNIAGKREEVVDILIDSAKIENYKISLEQAINTVSNNHILIAAGTINNKVGKFSVKVPGLLKDLDDINNLPIVKNENSIIKLGDIAEIRKTFKDRESYARVNNQDAIVLEVSKRTGKNIIETVEQVKYLVNDYKKLLPDNVNVAYSADESSDIISMLSDLNNNIIAAILLVVVLIMLFVGIRSSILIGITIPASFLISILVLKLLGITLSMMVLFSLILSVGMIVDTAIVVVEMADRKITEGQSAKQAYITSVDDVKWAITSSTVTTLIVFMPLLFWPGVVGQFMKYLPMTLIVTLTSSLVVSLFFSPVLGTLFGKKTTDSIKEAQIYHDIENGNFNNLKGFTGKYISLLDKVLQYPKKFCLIVVSAIIVVVILYSQLNHGVEFFPKVEPEFAKVNIRARGNLSLDEKDKLVREVEHKLKSLQSDIDIFYTRVSNDNMSSGGNLDIVAEIQLDLKNWRFRRKSEVIINDIRKLVSDIPAIITDVSVPRSGPPSDKPIDINVIGKNINQINNSVNKIIEIMHKVGGFVDIETNQSPPEIEWEIVIDKNKTALFNVDVALIGNYIKLATNGLKVASYRPDDTDEEVDIIVRFPEDQRNITFLDHIKIITNDGNVIPISNFITKKANRKIDSLDKINGKRYIKIKANIKSDLQIDQQFILLKNEISKDMDIIKNTNIEYAGDSEDQDETANFLKKSFIIAIIMMTLMLLVEFNSFYMVFVIMSAIFLSTTGVLLGLVITGRPFGIVMCGLGVISLAGIVVNNNILLIDTYQKFKDKNLSDKDSIMRACAQRIRPILLTSGTTILGLLPMILKVNFDFITRDISFNSPSSQWWVHMSTTIAGGLFFATILTLFLTPALLILEKKLTSNIKNLYFKLKKKSKNDYKR